MTKAASRYATEAALCAEFIGLVRELGTWEVYSECEGWDMLLVRKADGVQIGIEAKLKLNALVVDQVIEDSWSTCSPGPDYRAVLVPEAGGGFSENVCAYLGITIIRVRHFERFDRALKAHVEAGEIVPMLPGDDPRNRRYFSAYGQWHDVCPSKRHRLPEYVPDCVAGTPSPLTLTDWKIGAIKLAVLMEVRPITRADFKHVDIDHRRWIAAGAEWLQLAPDRSGWIAGPRIPDFRAQHPLNFEQIKGDIAKWAPPTLLAPAPMQQSLALGSAA